eukprot:5407840-Pleurochrysis_carterae.AAC.3
MAHIAVPVSAAYKGQAKKEKAVVQATAGRGSMGRQSSPCRVLNGTCLLSTTARLVVRRAPHF